MDPDSKYTKRDVSGTSEIELVDHSISNNGGVKQSRDETRDVKSRGISRDDDAKDCNAKKGRDHK